MGTHGSAGIQVPMRWGKTKLAIDTAGCLHMKHGITRVLAVTTTSGLGVWEKEIPKHCPFPVVVINYKGDIVHQSPKVLDESKPLLRFMVIHHAILYGRDFDWGETPHEWVALSNDMVEDFDPEFIIIDESHRIGDPSSMQCKMAYRYGKKARFRLTLTGTAFHRGPLKVFGQFKFMDDSIFGTAITPFKRLYVRYGGYGNYEIVGYRNLEDMAEKIKQAVFIEEKVELVKPVVTTTPVEMEECREVYREMEREAAITVKGHDVLAPIILTKHLRCQQIAGGWVKVKGKYIRVGSEKKRALSDKLELTMEEGIEKIVIGARFIPELKDIARAAKNAGYRVGALHGGIPRGEERDRRIEAFQESEQPMVMVCQVQAAAEAIDMSEAGMMLLYSLPESYLIYDQFKSRIEKYMEKRTLLYDHLLMKGSRDEVTWLAMNLKMDVARFLIKHPDIVERITEREIGVWYNGNVQ